MNKLQLFNNENLNLKVRALTNDDGSISVSMEDVARGLGFTTVATSGNEVVRWNRVNKYLKEFGIPTCGYDDFIPESVFYLLAMKASNEKAKKFQLWVAKDVIPAIRKTGSYKLPDNPMDILKLTYEALSQTNDNVSQHEYRIKELEDNKLLNPGEYNYISKAVKNKVKQVMSELNMDLKGKQKSQIYHAINRDLNTFIGIKTRSQFKAKDFDKALEFIQNWQLSYTDKKIIEQLELNI